MDVSTSLGINLEADAQRTLERVYERLPVMMYAANSAGRIVDVNTYWLKRLGYKKEQVLGRSSADFMPAGDTAERRKVWAQLMRGEEVTDWSMQYLSATGEVIDGLLYGAPVLNAKLELTGAIATVFDVTELRAAERARDQLETELRLSQKLEAIGQLAAGIAHEINTPSQYVSDNLTFLQDAVTNLLPLLSAFEPLLALAAKSVEAKLAPLGAIDDYRVLLKDADLEYIRGEIPLAIQQSRDGVAQIKKIVMAMKEFSHPGADEKEPVDLNRAIQATVMVARNEWKYVADVVLELDDTIPVIEAIPSAMNQVVLNLVVNAAHAIEEAGRGESEKGKITISTRRDGAFVELTVADTGCGIPAENVARIFDPFFTTKKIGKGTGQGLAIVRRVVIDRHGGALDVQSTVGEGTRFHVRLPIEGSVAALERLTA